MFQDLSAAFEVGYWKEKSTKRMNFNVPTKWIIFNVPRKNTLKWTDIGQYTVGIIPSRNTIRWTCE